MPNFIKISGTVAEIWRCNGFFKMAAVRHVGILAAIGTTHDDHLMVSIIVQNLVKVDAVDACRSMHVDAWNFQYFARLA